ncbi:MAG TPA: YbhB/YbcL family Raf kinase inhibitor-like protein [Polyangiaceae bacterium]
MNTRRSLASVFLLSLPVLLLSHCATDEADDDSAAGTGNAASGSSGGGSGGSAGTAAGGKAGGGSGTAGTGSAAGPAGGGPTGGAGAGGSNGGNAGSGGTTGGTGGSVGGGGTGGSSGSSAGSSGAGGSSGGSAGAGAGGSSGAGGAFGGAGSGGGGAGGSSGGSGGSGGGGAFTLTSSKLAPDMMMPDDFTCEGDAHNPPLAWSGVPAGTMSFAMLFVDTTIIVPMPTSAMGYHSAIWDIPASVTEMPEDLPRGATLTTPFTAKQYNPVCASNPGYLGPCAQHEDEYEFRLYALPVATLTGNFNSVQAVQTAIMAANPLGVATLHVKADARGTLKCPGG